LRDRHLHLRRVVEEWPPSGAWMSSRPRPRPIARRRRLPNARRRPSRCHAPNAQPKSIPRRRHAASLEALWVHRRRPWSHEVMSSIRTPECSAALRGVQRTGRSAWPGPSCP
jgi:hypothetical protein